MSTIAKIRTPLFIVVALSAAALSGCYVVPVHPDGRPYQGSVIVSPTPSLAVAPVVAPPPAAPAVANLRLYPSNEAASRIGVVSGQVVNLLDGRGQFSVTVGGETFTGEATRTPNKSNSGVASGAGSRGGFLSCQYSMSSPTQGVGTCNLSSGAAFRMHIGG
ncbi:MAG: hypothetical protein ACRDAM_13525 [Casimicrobium sp.]